MMSWRVELDIKWQKFPTGLVIDNVNILVRLLRVAGFMVYQGGLIATILGEPLFSTFFTMKMR